MAESYPTHEVLVNGTYDSVHIFPTYNGFTISKYTPNGDMDSLINDPMIIIQMGVNPIVQVGSIMVGNYYQMPHSADLSLTMTREYGGVKTIETKGGSSLSNSFYDKPPMWGQAGAWELYSAGSTLYKQKLSASGRRIWDLSFSYLSQGDSFGANQHLRQSQWGDFNSDDYDTDSDGINDINDDGYYRYNVLTDYSFYSQVLHRTRGQLPFLFQPNGDDNTVFAICKFDMSSFKHTQVSPSLYSCQLKIREVW